MSALPQTLLPPRPLRGTVDLAGLFFAAPLVPEGEARRRILELLAEGDRVLRTPDGLLLLFAHRRPARLDTVPGEPLVSHGPGWISYDPRSPESPPVPAETWWRVRAGIQEELALPVFPPEDPADWIDLEAYAVGSPISLGEPAPGVAPPAETARLLDDVLKDIPKRSEATKTLLEKMARQARDQTKRTGGVSGGSRSGAPSFWGNLWNTLFSTSTGSSSGGSGTAADANSPNRFHMALYGVLRRLGATLVLGYQRSLFLGRLLQMMDRGDIEETLRHAIPLSNSNLHGQPSLGFLGPRDQIRITPFAPGSSDVMLGDNLYFVLRQRYEGLAKQLEEQGKLDRAAFVLAELLDEGTRAVDLFERHGQYDKAAEIAELKRLSGALVVRLWFLANKPERAIRQAIARGAFREAVVRMERDQHPQASELRLLWATAEGEAGDPSRAVEILWEDSTLRPLARPWMQRAEDDGGLAELAVLGYRAALEPESVETLWHRVLDRVAQEEQADAVLRTVGDSLLAVDPSDAVHLLRRRFCRLGLAHGGGVPPRKMLLSLSQRSGDEALAEDIRQLPKEQDAPPLGILSHRPRFPPDDRGRLPIEDAAVLGDGRLLVAHGEHGIRLLSPSGRPLGRIDQPAERLVVGRGSVALALMRRGPVWRVARLDLARLTGEVLAELRLAHFTRNLHGRRWFVVAGEELLVLDAAGGDPQHGFPTLWRLELDHVVWSMAQHPEKGLALVVGEPPLVWILDTGLVLRRRLDMLSPAALDRSVRPFSIQVDAAGQALALLFEPDETTEEGMIQGETWAEAIVNEVGQRLPEIPNGPPDQVAWCGRYVVALATEPLEEPAEPTGEPSFNTSWDGVPGDTCQFTLLDLDHRKTLLEIYLEGVRSVDFRGDDKHLLVWDNLGRLLHFDLRGSPRRVANLRT